MMFSILNLVFVFSFIAQVPGGAPSTGVGLKWADPNNASIPNRGYTIYRMQGPCPTGNPVMANFAPIATAGPGNSTDGLTYSYVNGGLMPGIYCYVVTATAPGFIESMPSNMAQATVGSPQPPPTSVLQPPTNLTAVPQ